MKKFTLALLPLFLMACGGSGNSSSQDTAKAVDDDAFYATQPIHSGLYDAETYDITGKSDRKGHFDGRIYFSLSPEMSAFYVFENGNRTKIDYTVTLKHPFEIGDSGIYRTIDAKDLPVSITPDSALYYLSFQRSGEDVKIGFSPKPRHVGNALEILERMAAQKKK